jgi:hypothetical protein
MQCHKIQCDEKSEFFCKIYQKLNKGLGDTQGQPVMDSLSCQLVYDFRGFLPVPVQSFPESDWFCSPCCSTRHQCTQRQTPELHLCSQRQA